MSVFDDMMSSGSDVLSSMLGTSVTYIDSDGHRFPVTLESRIHPVAARDGYAEDFVDDDSETELLRATAVIASSQVPDPQRLERIIDGEIEWTIETTPLKKAGDRWELKLVSSQRITVGAKATANMTKRRG